MRIDALHPLIRGYLALGFALDNPAIDIKEGNNIRKQRLEIFDSFTPEHKKELTLFIDYRNKLNEGTTNPHK